MIGTGLLPHPLPNRLEGEHRVEDLLRLREHVVDRPLKIGKLQDDQDALGTLESFVAQLVEIEVAEGWEISDGCIVSGLVDAGDPLEGVPIFFSASSDGMSTWIFQCGFSS